MPLFLGKTEEKKLFSSFDCLFCLLNGLLGLLYCLFGLLCFDCHDVSEVREIKYFYRNEIRGRSKEQCEKYTSTPTEVVWGTLELGLTAA